MVDERRRGREVGLDSILDGTIRNGDREMRLAAAWFSGKDQAASFSYEVSRQV